MSTFELADGFQIERVAAEPLVADPVAMEIDGRGRMWVVEMHGYPLDVSGSGVIKRLVDTDADGWPDRAVVFADSLTLPTGIMAWKEGLLVTDAPDVLYLEDTDGDGRADHREVVLTGFARSNPQHNLNTPRFELDNWIYLAHEGTIGTKFFQETFGDEGEAIRFPAHPDAPRLPRNAAGRSLRFQPDAKRVEMLSGETQFGYSFSPWGELLNGSNYYYLFHEVLPARYLARNPDLRVDDPTHNLPAGGPGTTIFPITRNPKHQLLTDAGVITSGCGVTWYKGGAFPEPYDRVSLVAEPVHNLVHADRIENAGASFRAHPLMEGREFLASTDSWFRPVNFYVGPDGALYLMDYYREIIEHPEWMSEAVNASGRLYNGVDRGRIYRISPVGTPPPNFSDRLSLPDQSAEDLTRHLASPNIWWRRHAQRLLVSGKRVAAIPFLKDLLRQDSAALGRLHALWALHGLEGLAAEDVALGLTDPEPGLRINALRVAELLPALQGNWSTAVLALADDPEARVRFQALLTLGGIDSPEARAAVQTILLRDLDDPWVHLAALSSPWIHQLNLRQLHAQAAGREGLEAFLGAYAELIGRRGRTVEVADLLQQVEGFSGQAPATAAALLRGMGEGMDFDETPIGQAAYRRLAGLFSPRVDKQLRGAALQLLHRSGYFRSARPDMTAQAREYLRDSLQPPDMRQDAARVVAWTLQHQAIETLWPLIGAGESADLQVAVLDALQPWADSTLCRQVLDSWASLTPKVREQAINLFRGSPAQAQLLLDALERGVVKQDQIGWRRSVALLNADDDGLRARARQLLRGNESDAEAVADQARRILDLPGRAERGQAVFNEHCATCHQLNGKDGLPLGPDLAAVRNRTPAAILHDVLEPNASIADGFELWGVVRNDGSRVGGILVGESSGFLSLRTLDGEVVRIERQRIAELNVQPYSAMPEGMETQMTEQEMADLLAMLSGRLQ